MPKKIILPKKKGIGNQLSLFAEDNELLLKRKKIQHLGKKINDQRYSFKENLVTYIQENKHANLESLRKNYSDFNLEILKKSNNFLSTHDKLILSDIKFLEKKIVANPESKYLPGIHSFLIRLRREGGQIMDLLDVLKSELKSKEQLSMSRSSHNFDSQETSEFNQAIADEEAKISKLKEDILSLHSDFHTKREFYFNNIRKNKHI